MQKRLQGAMRIFLLTTIFFCTTQLFSQQWQKMADFPDLARDDAAAFVIGGYAYVGTGRDIGFQFCRDFYAYHIKENKWHKITDLPGDGRQYCSSFVLNGKGYLVGGVNAVNHFYNELWEYNPDTDTWQQKASLPAHGRAAGIALTIGNKAYYGTGRNANTLFNDWWEYNADSDTWNRKSDVPCEAFYESVGYCLNGKCYVGLGKTNHYHLKSIWQYDTLHNSWTHNAEMPFGLSYAVAANLGLKAYIATGQKENSDFFSEVLEYNSIAKIWTSISNFPTVAVRGVAVFSSNDAIYFATGLNQNFQRSKELWKFIPEKAHGNNEFVIYPAVAKQEVKLHYSFSDTLSSYHFFLCNLQGKTIHFGTLNPMDNFYHSTYAESSLPLILILRKNEEIIYRAIVQVAQQ